MFFLLTVLYIVLVKDQHDLFRHWFIAIYNETHLRLVKAHLYLCSNILSIHTFLITLDYQINGGGEGGGGLGILTYLISRGEGSGKVEIEVFLAKWGKMEKLTSDGYSFGTRK